MTFAIGRTILRIMPVLIVTSEKSGIDKRLDIKKFSKEKAIEQIQEVYNKTANG